MALRAVTSAAFAAVLVGLAGCGEGAPAVVPAPGVQPKDCGRFTIAVNPWVGYEANAAVVDRAKTTYEAALQIGRS